MTMRILKRLAESGLLFDSLAEQILSGVMPPIEDILVDLVDGAMDCHAVTVGDPKSTWNEKRIARQCLAVAFLMALVSCGEDDCVNNRRSPTELHGPVDQTVK